MPLAGFPISVEKEQKHFHDLHSQQSPVIILKKVMLTCGFTNFITRGQYLFQKLFPRKNGKPYVTNRLKAQSIFGCLHYNPFNSVF